MPVCEADPWRLQYFEHAPCPDDVLVPTEDADAWVWYPRHRWVYDKVAVALSQGLAAAPHGVTPPSFPVFSKPIINLRGMGTDSRVIASAQEYRAHLTPGHMWMSLLEGEHISTDVAIVKGQPVWWRHATGEVRPGGTFDFWHVHAEALPELEQVCGAWVQNHLAGYTGMLNVETIGGRIIEAHLRFADQWPDLYGAGWVETLIRLYAEGLWVFADAHRRDGYSVVLFGPHARRYQHPPTSLVQELLGSPEISSVQITFHEGWEPAHHAMPPGGFRLAIVNAFSLEAGKQARKRLADALL